jgi:hypothetical protein
MGQSLPDQADTQTVAKKRRGEDPVARLQERARWSSLTNTWNGSAAPGRRTALGPPDDCRGGCGHGGRRARRRPHRAVYAQLVRSMSSPSPNGRYHIGSGVGPQRNVVAPNLNRWLAVRRWFPWPHASKASRRLPLRRLVTLRSPGLGQYGPVTASNQESLCRLRHSRHRCWETTVELGRGRTLCLLEGTPSHDSAPTALWSSPPR